MTDFNLWNKSLTNKEVQSFSNCNSIEDSNRIIDWNNLTMILNDTIIEYIDKDKICPQETEDFFIASGTLQKWEDTYDYCLNVVGGELAVTENNDTIFRMTEAMKGNLTQSPNKLLLCFSMNFICSIRYPETLKLIFKFSNSKLERQLLLQILQWLSKAPR